MTATAVGIVSHDGFIIMRCRSGDRFYVRLFIGEKLIDVYFAHPDKLSPLTKVDASPSEPNPPMWDEE